MSDKQLRSKLIRLAHANPSLRGDLLPLLAQTKLAAADHNSYSELLQEAADTFHKAVVAAIVDEIKKRAVFTEVKDNGRGLGFITRFYGQDNGNAFRFSLQPTHLGTERTYDWYWGEDPKTGARTEKAGHTKVVCYQWNARYLASYLLDKAGLH